MCLAVFGVYVSLGGEGLANLTTLTSLFQQFLVAMATSFCRKLDMEVSGTHFSHDLVAAIGELQLLAYRTLVSRGKLLSDADLEGVVRLCRAALEAQEDDAVTSGASLAGSREGGSRDGVSREGGSQVNGHGGGEGPGEKVQAVGAKVKVASAAVSDVSLLMKMGLLQRVGIGAAGRWSFTCSMTREFLAARHLADMAAEALSDALNEQKILRHPRFAQTASFLCGILGQEADSDLLPALLKDLSVQVGSLSVQVSSLSVYVGSLSVLVSSFSVQVSSLSVQVSSLSVQVGFLSVQVSTLTVQVSSLSVQVSSLSVQVGSLSVQVSTLTVQVSSLSVQVGSLSVQVSTLTVQVSSLSVQVSSLSVQASSGKSRSKRRTEVMMVLVTLMMTMLMMMKMMK